VAGGSPAGGVAAGGTTAGGTTSGTAGGTTAGTGFASTLGGITAGTSVGGTVSGGGTTSGGTMTVVEAPCEKKVRTAGKTVPDFMIVLDRSGSMRPPTIDCRMPDIVSAFTICLAVDCNDPAQQMGPACGGSMVVDRWAPAVMAIKSLTQMFQGKVSFGLTTFPGQGASTQAGQQNGCTPGTLRVPVGLNTAGPIASALDMTQPDGFTPTASTLEAVLQQIQQKKTSPDAEVPPQFILLVTDGAPNCIGGNSGMDAQAHQATVKAVDALAKAGVKTFVIGYDASVDPNLAKQLTEYAQHGGTNNFFAVQDGPSLVAKFGEITSVVAECTYALDKAPADKMYVRVELDKMSLPVDSPDGWSINDKTVTVQGAACAKLRDGSKTHTLAVTVECVPVVIN
jgi:von Willebrand factor type A domain